ncbi:BTB/POZ domain-containing adapter for CUL3-mediated RhoA degradation protein 3-like [Panonychus citri]|uniref:BTB/POZ domain-containing adapter for CUL3-mediated RhoA degradation protein 3-like n=1 Tax=Panonychus citri TaxID=50023 RepID=UPI0023072F85|nr:BTB/POZ domain-containing adapter for CUL3-mediated RhoA degradation protein 3-like [Panonychus citri]
MIASCESAIPNKRSVVFLQNDKSEYVKLNVGGLLFQTTVVTLTKFDTMFKAMFSGRMEVTKDSEGWILIDRNGEHFRTILKYLRDGSVSLPKKMKDLKDLLAEAQYYLIEGLIAPCESRLERLKAEPNTRVRMFLSPEKEAKFIANSKKPIVKLSTNRPVNDGYDEELELNLLRNRELFEKLCLKCSPRIIFVLNKKTTNQVCCWSFYNDGEKILDVNCAPLSTKVEFLRSKIYEEVLYLSLRVVNKVADDSEDGSTDEDDSSEDEE